MPKEPISRVVKRLLRKNKVVIDPDIVTELLDLIKDHIDQTLLESKRYTVNKYKYENGEGYVFIDSISVPHHEVIKHINLSKFSHKYFYKYSVPELNLELFTLNKSLFS